MALTRAYMARDIAEAQFVCDLLRAEGIPAVVMGEHLDGLGGAIPFASAQPAVCVHRGDLPHAARIVAGLGERLSRRKRAASLWRCPTCGEMHEPQFSACWSCGAARPAGEGDPEDVPQPTGSLEELTMKRERGLPCTSCGYDLRGLPAAHSCPECGYPVVGSVLDQLSLNSIADPADLDLIIRGPFEAVARETGLPVDAVLVIGHAWLRTLLPMESRMPDDPIDPADLCLALRSCAIRYFGTANEARTLFRRWGILGGEQIAQIGTALLDAGLLPPSTPIDQDSLRGRLTLEDLFP